MIKKIKIDTNDKLFLKVIKKFNNLFAEEIKENPEALFFIINYIFDILVYTKVLTAKSKNEIVKILVSDVADAIIDNINKDIINNNTINKKYN